MNIDDKIGRLRTLIHNIGYFHNYVDMDQYLEYLNKQIVYI